MSDTIEQTCADYSITPELIAVWVAQGRQDARDGIHDCPYSLGSISADYWKLGHDNFEKENL